MNIIQQNAALKFLKNQLASYKIKYEGVNSLEEKNVIKALVDQLVYKIRMQDFSFAPIDHARANVNDINSFYRELETLSSLNEVYLQEIYGYLDEYNGVYKIALTRLLNQYRTLQQKLSTYKIWHNENKFVLYEGFNNFKHIKESSFNIDVNNGVAVLPIVSVENIIPATITILSDSNGRAGSNVNGVLINYLVDNLKTETENSFYYSVRDSGPCKLSLEYVFDKSNIINSCKIKLKDSYSNQKIQIQDIVFITNSQEYSIKDISVYSELDLFFDSLSVENEIVLYFLPIECQRIVFKFVSLNSDDQLRPHWSIDLEYIKTVRNLYGKSASLTSNDYNINRSFALVSLLGYRGNKSLDNFQLSYRSDVSSWNTIGFNSPYDVKSIDTVLLQGIENLFSYKLGYTQNNVGYSVDGSTDFIKQRLFLNKNINSFSNDQNIVQVLQTKAVYFGDQRNYNSGFLGTTYNGINYFDLPFDLTDTGWTPDDLTITVGRRDYTLASDWSDPSVGEFGITEDYKSVIINNGNGGEPAYIKLPSEILALREEPLKYTARIKYKGVYDSTDLKIYRVPSNGNRRTITLPRDRTNIVLGYQDIVSGSVVFNSKNGQTFNAVESRAALISSGDYYLQTQFGVLYLFEKIGDDTVTITFNEFTLTELSDKDYSISLDEDGYATLEFPREGFQVFAVEEDGSDLDTKLNPRTRLFINRVSPFPASNTKRALSYYNIIQGSLKIQSDFFISGETAQEVPYIDGMTEFLGLIETTEYTNSMQAAATGLVSFKLTAGNKWYHDFAVEFDNQNIFGSKVTSPTSLGEYSISNAGIVTVFIGVGNTLPGNVAIHYFYKDALFVPDNKYSVDYPGGYIYSYSEQNMSSLIYYHTATYKIEYHMAKELEFTQQDKLITLKSNLNESNELVLLSKNVANNNLGNYYSPIITFVGFRFS